MARKEPMDPLKVSLAVAGAAGKCRKSAWRGSIIREPMDLLKVSLAVAEAAGKWLASAGEAPGETV